MYGLNNSDAGGRVRASSIIRICLLENMRLDFQTLTPSDEFTERLLNLLTAAIA